MASDSTSVCTIEAMDYLDLLRDVENRLDDDGLNQLNEALVGLEKLYGLRYTDISREQVVAEVDIDDRLRQYVGVVNGGVMAGVAESVAGVAGLLAAGQHVVGVNNSTDLIRPAKEGVLRAVAKPIHTGRSTQLFDVEITNSATLVARSTMRNMVLN
ncbi:PaaI family thioesterase [Corynebacterium yudongzhengii]|nr:PaaI family thioesterase [Corynebacterium yudongzhengii]